ncbi:MAG: hypothetical protein RsTaC01_0645 [Candidatus Paraimprobicoccus trichonymphae]|uniref:Uncharacterized protein n=1 Tax=Candidatus Paraimprobicoccus trichonymphae TaxID=3033793 RepID=A0AA48I9V2_9FIRM|nr:MAG: hypothetical protein RsTaC01_0645 [Candidatus Paraimprobicoccus trichonymphae]
MSVLNFVNTEIVEKLKVVIGKNAELIRYNESRSTSDGMICYSADFKYTIVGTEDEILNENKAKKKLKKMAGKKAELIQFEVKAEENQKIYTAVFRIKFTKNNLSTLDKLKELKSITDKNAELIEYYGPKITLSGIVYSANFEYTIVDNEDKILSEDEAKKELKKMAGKEAELMKFKVKTKNSKKIYMAIFRIKLTDIMGKKEILNTIIEKIIEIENVTVLDFQDFYNGNYKLVVADKSGKVYIENFNESVVFNNLDLLSYFFD